MEMPMFTKLLFISIILSFCYLANAADCPFNKPYSRSEKCLCKGIKDVDANNMLVCKDQGNNSVKKDTPPIANCELDSTFDKDFKCVCPPKTKKYFLRDNRNVCLAKDQKLSECSINTLIKNSVICHCPKETTISNIGPDSFKCLDNKKITEDAKKPAETTPEKSTAKKPTDNKKKATAKKSKKK